jgi:hypothetical protein
MHRDANERGIEVSPGQLCVLVLADVVEAQGLATTKQLEEIDKSLVVIAEHTQ